MTTNKYRPPWLIAYHLNTGSASFA